MKRYAVLALALAVGSTLAGCTNPGGLEAQQQKDAVSSSQGLHRVVTVYSQDGKTILRQYEGQFDVDSSNGRIKFDIWGKRVLIYNSPVIIEEK